LGGASRSLTVNSLGSTEISGGITNGALTKAGPGRLTLSGASTYDGGTTLSEGILTVGSDTALGTGLLTINGGTLQARGTRVLGNAIGVLSDVTLAGGTGDILTLDGAVNLGGATAA
jgi:fibronectin-binding autotransporter adhesin